MTMPEEFWRELRRLLPDADLVVLPEIPAGRRIGLDAVPPPTPGAAGDRVPTAGDP